jgi:hypothetical protein
MTDAAQLCYGREIIEGSNELVMDVELQRQKVPTAFWKENLFDNYMKD